MYDKKENIALFQDKLKQLVEFNPALIYGFEPESSPRRLAGSETYADSLFPEAAQQEDMLAAYLFAQDSILPFIRKHKLEKISKEDLLGWITTLHSFIGKSLLELHGVTAGKYTERMISRWHDGSEIRHDFFHYLLGIHFCRSDNQFVDHLNKNHGANKQDCLDFIKLLKKIHSNKTLDFDKSELKYLNDSPQVCHEAIITMHKLSFAYNNGTFLSSKEKLIVDKIVKICIFPAMIPTAMEQFAQETLAHFALCDKGDLKEISKFLAKTFYSLTEIHPFPNANGRVATCLMNIFLRSFDLPSILLRHPGDRNDKESKYSCAIAKIDKSLEPLQDLILTRIQMAQMKPFSDDVLEKLITLRVGLSEQFQRFHKKYPSFILEFLNNQLSLKINNLPSLELAQYARMRPEEQSITALTALIDIAAKEEQKLDHLKQMTISPLFIPQEPIKIETKNQLIADLNHLTGHNGWKVNDKNGLVSWLEISDMAEAQKITNTLKETDAMKVVLSRRQDTKVPVVKCEQINCFKLNQLAITNDKLVLEAKHTL